MVFPAHPPWSRHHEVFSDAHVGTKQMNDMSVEQTLPGGEVISDVLRSVIYPMPYGVTHHDRKLSFGQALTGIKFH